MFNSVVSFIFVGVNFHGFEGTEMFAYIPIHDFILSQDFTFIGVNLHGFERTEMFVYIPIHDFDPVTGLHFRWCKFSWI